MKKEIQKFVQITKQKAFFLLLVLLLFFLPGENFYEKLRLETEEPLTREVEINLPAILDYPVNVKGAETLFLTAKSAMVIDVSSKVVLLAKNPDSFLPPASTTKIMTALIVLENYQLDDVLVVPKITNLIGQNMGLLEGERMTVENLLYGVLVHSANDAALTLASSYSGGIEEFIYSMNQKANELGLFDTHFANISGIDQVNHYSTVRDLAHLTSHAMENPLFAKIVEKKRITVVDIDRKHWHELETTNELIGKVFGLKGVKTGWTESAGECLIAYVARNEREIITVILGSKDRFSETERLVNWVFKNFEWLKVTPATQN